MVCTTGRARGFWETLEADSETEDDATGLGAAFGAGAGAAS